MHVWWWESASPALRFALTSSLLFVALMGLQGLAVFFEGAFEVLDSATERLSWLILQVVLAACMSFGWTFVALSALMAWPDWLLGVISLFAAGMTAFLGWVLLKGFKKLQESFDYKDAAEHLIGRVGEVYLPIPKGGSGQVKLKYRGVERYFAAKCVNGQDIGVFQRVCVKGVERAPTGEPILLSVEVLREAHQKQK